MTQLLAFFFGIILLDVIVLVYAKYIILQIVRWFTDGIEAEFRIA